MKIKYLILVAVIGILISFSSCSPAGGEFQGNEFVPDMAHGIAYEANYYDYYHLNTWGTEEDYYNMVQPREPVAGTIARGYAGGAKPVKVDVNNPNAISIPANGSVPYYYSDTEEERTRAMNEIISNPYPITNKGLDGAKDLYDIYCGICHGEKGDGNGYLVDENNPNQVYPAQPAILTNDEFTAASNGRMYHAIMYGKNVMGGYADKLSYEERWQVIHYIRLLQAKERKLTYSEEENTLNAIDIPGASIASVVEEHHDEVHDDEGGEDHSEGHDAEGDHSHDHGGHDHDGGQDH